MSTSSFQKISAAVVAVVLSGSAMSHAAPTGLPYKTSWTTTGYPSDTNSDTYSPGALQGTAGAGQGHNNGTDNSSFGWVNESGEFNTTATVQTGGGVVLAANQTGSTSTLAVPVYSDVYNSNLADHAAVTNGNGSALAASTYNNLVNVQWGMTVTAPTVGNGFSSDSGTNSFSKAGFGVEIIGSDDKLIASLFDVSNPNHAGEKDAVVNQSDPSQATDPTLVGGTDGSAATYSINLNFNNDTFTVFVNGTKGGTYNFANAESSIGAVTLATDNFGNDQATFSSLSVVPEPASLAMIGLGGLVLLARRPKRTV
jgi:hypothetical protein